MPLFIPTPEKSRFVGNKTITGNLTLGAGSAAAPALVIGTTPSGLYARTTAILGFSVNGAEYAALSTNGSAFSIRAAGSYGWSSTTDPSAGSDLFLFRDATGVLAQRNSTNAQGFRVYNTYTDTSNYERGYMEWQSNLLVIGVDRTGTGSDRHMRFVTGASDGIITFADIGNVAIAQMSRTDGIRLAKNFQFKWSGTDNNSNGAGDVGISRLQANVVALTNGTTGSGALGLSEMSDPIAPAADKVILYAKDNGAGKTQLMAIFSSGAAQQVAIQP